jgi:CheY-like chemotaxis protein
MSILYIDDDAEDREIFTDALEMISPEIICHTACDGIEGLKVLFNLRTPPDAIFLDVNMPKMNGAKFLQELQTIIAFKAIPVFIYSTSVDSREHLEYIQLGAKEVLTKHCSFGQICDTIRKALQLNLIR